MCRELICYLYEYLLCAHSLVSFHTQPFQKEMLSFCTEFALTLLTVLENRLLLFHCFKLHTLIKKFVKKESQIYDTFPTAN